MKKKPFDMTTGTIHKSNNFGDVRIVKYNGNTNVMIEFINSGTIGIFSAGNIRNGRMRDCMQPSLCGVGFIGDGSYKASSKGRLSDQYNCWRSMIDRCYSDKYHEKRPSYRNCEVCEEWQDFQVFAEWYDNNHPDDGGNYHLDKDIMVDGNKVYSPHTCMFVTCHENTSKAMGCYGRVVTLISKSGESRSVENLAEFCSEYNINTGNISQLIKGKAKTCKGWRLGKIEIK